MSALSFDSIAGVDEVGRGCLAGPVVAAAVILPSNHSIKGLKDSKQLTPKRREELFEEIIHQCIAYELGRAEVAEIEQLNIHHASLLAMQRAVEALSVKPSHVLVDGSFAPLLTIPTQTIPGGDRTEPFISAASIIAKVSRDREMVDYEKKFPGYGLAQHKGYGTKQHISAIKELGITELHRKEFSIDGLKLKEVKS